MKKITQIFPRDSYISASSTTDARSYRHDVKLFSLLGQAKTILIRFYGYNKSTNSKARIRVYSSSIRSGTPEETGKQLLLSGDISTLRPSGGSLDPIAINAPFEGLIQINLEILNETGSAQEFFDAEVSATLIIED